MKKVKCFYLKECPYCIQAQKAVKELKEKNPQYQPIDIEWIEETEQPDIIDQYDYYATPSMFIDHTKLYEAHLYETYEECLQHVQEVFEKAIA